MIMVPAQAKQVAIQMTASRETVITKRIMVTMMKPMLVKKIRTFAVNLIGGGRMSR